MRAAFLANLADDGILFAPTPVPGRAVHEGKPEVPGTLAWEPAFAGIGRDGDLGYTTGPFTYTSHDSTQDVGHGHYVTIWRRKADGTWRVALDTGISHPPIAPRHREEVELEQGDEGAAVGGEGLAAAEERLAEATEQQGYEQAFRTFAAEGVRTYRDGTLPVVGRNAGAALLEQHPDYAAWEPDGAEASADLGYAYGVMPHAGEESARSSFLRIWRKGGTGQWEIVLDLATPVPDR
jgi:ketosteroid isomerase-like protein